MSGQCDCGALDCLACYPGPRPRTEEDRARGWWPGDEAEAGAEIDDEENDEQKGSGQ
jgi:hypothetical protein